MRVITAIFLLNFVRCYQWKSIYDRIMDEPEFSGYKNMIKGNNIVTLDLLYSGVTLFVPENEAFQRYDGFLTANVVLYHVGTEPYTLRDFSLNNSVESAHSDNPPIWVSVVEEGYYLNNAKIIEKKSNYVSKPKRNTHLKQVLHVIDRVLDPMLETPLSNPSAHDFLQNYQNWKIGSRKVSNFFNRVHFHEKDSLFQKPGGHTFFIPINDPRHDHRLQYIDAYIIEAHVIPNLVLFTRPTPRNFVYETAANGDYIYIVLSLVTQNARDYVKSHTVLGDTKHRKGEVLAEIVKANIPVTNGVVHLISQPLAVFDRELKPFPYLSVWYKIAADPELSSTYRAGLKGRVNKILKSERGMYTFFAPRNRIWEDYSGYTTDERGDILSRHLIVSDGRYTMSMLLSSSKSNGTILETLAGTLIINVTYTNGSFYITWGQNMFRVYRPDYECTDGVVHIIDGIFAPPKSRPSHYHPQKMSFWKSLKNMVT